MHAVIFFYSSFLSVSGFVVFALCVIPKGLMLTFSGTALGILWIQLFCISLTCVDLGFMDSTWKRFYFYPIAFSLFFLASFIEDGVEKVQSQWRTPEESGEKLKQTHLLKMWGWPLYPPPRAQRMSPWGKLCFPVSPHCVFLTSLSRLVYWECTGFSQSVCFDSSLMLLWLL